jgi:hypothetical protein
MSDELFEVLEIFKQNSQELEALKEEVTRMSQDILEMKIENSVNSDLKNRFEQLADEVQVLREQSEDTLNIGGQINSISHEVTEAVNELKINEGRINDISEKSIYLEQYVENVKENDKKLNDILNKSYYIEQFMEGIQEREINLIIEDEKINVSDS